MFGAYEGDWHTPAVITLAWCFVFAFMASRVKNWRYEHHLRMTQVIDV
jgi:hypothetical protein